MPFGTRSVQMRDGQTPCRKLVQPSDTAEMYAPRKPRPLAPVRALRHSRQMDVALYQPDIPQNTAAILRTARCFDAAVHIVGPAAFDLSDRAVRRAGLDYAATARLVRHVSWDAFVGIGRRIVLFSTRAATDVVAFPFRADDVLLFGRESAGVPEHVHAACPAVRIPLAPGARSLNLAVSVGIGLFEAMRVAGALPERSAA